MEAVFEALKQFINERPNLDPANYGMARGQTPDRKQWFECLRSFNQEKRSITADGTRARKALREALEYPFNAAVIAEAFGRAFSGRLSWNGHSLEYCTGQYYPTEYRKAAAAVLEYYNHAVRPKFTPPAGKVFTDIDEIKSASRRRASRC